MKTNKKVFIAIPIVIALIVFIGLLIYFNKEDANSFNASERKWLQSHVNTRENFEVISDYPVYGDSGVFYKFISSLEKATGLEFNVVPYFRNTTTSTSDLKLYMMTQKLLVMI